VEWPPPVGIGYVYFTTPCRPLATAFGQNFPQFTAFIGKLCKNAVIARSFFCYKKKLLRFQFLSIVKAWKLC
jgi:hypothetical protein